MQESLKNCIILVSYKLKNESRWSEFFLGEVQQMFEDY